MARVFISYASEDEECAWQLRGWLVDEGHKVFLDRDVCDGIAVGQEWAQRLHEGLRWADAVACVVSSASVASRWCWTEIGVALSRGSRVLPVRAEPGVVHPLVGSLQHVDLTVDPAGAQAALVQELRRVDVAGGRGWAGDRSPFPGLRALDVEEHRVFFGRGAEVEQLAGLLRSPAERAEETVLLVVGPSGCGKSSLVRAGLVPVMGEEPGWWTLPPVVPGADPVGALARELARAAQPFGLGWTVAQVRQQLDGSGVTGLVDDLLLAARARRLLLVVDQLEEVLTQTSPGQRAHFARLLGSALSGAVQVVATLRPEFLDQLLADSDLAVLVSRRPYTLRPLRREALRTVIEGPAQVAEIGVDEDLVDRLVADTDSGEALPLLAFTLAQLAEGLGRGDQLSQQRYERLGGVRGALIRQADEALADASASTGRDHREVMAGLLRLVTADEQGRPTRWRVPRDELPELVIRELEAFIRRRLVTTDTDDDTVVVGVAHEAFLSAWPPLARAIEQNVSALRARRAIEQAATEWNDNSRPPARLWERGQLAAALTDTGAHHDGRELVTDHVGLSPTARAFLQTSIRRDRLRRGRAITILSVLLAVAVAAAGFAFTQQHTAVTQRDLTVSRQVAGQALALRTVNPALAAQLALAAYQLSSNAEARDSLLSVSSDRYATRLTGYTAAARPVAFSPDGHTLATASDDSTAKLWDLSDIRHPGLLATLTGTNTVMSVAFSPDSHTLATASNDRTAKLWDLSDLRHPGLLATLTGHTGTVHSVVFSPDSHTLATASGDGTARLWDLLGPILVGHTSTVRSVVFSPDGHTLATASTDNTAKLWDLSDLRHPGLLATLTGHTSSVYSVAFSPDGHTLATASDDSTAKLWDLSDLRHPGLLATLTGHTSTVMSVAFSPDGHTLATASTDNTAKLWDLSDIHHPGLLATLTGHTSTVESVAFSPDSHTLATASDDSTAKLWDLSDIRHPGLLATLIGHTNFVYSVAFSPKGHTLATASADGTTRLWETDDGEVAARICATAWPAITKNEWNQYLPGLTYQPPCP